LPDRLILKAFLNFLWATLPLSPVLFVKSYCDVQSLPLDP
jgi:hypothetical protein